MNYIPIFAAALILLSAVFGYVMESDHNPKKRAVYGGLIMAVILGIGYGISTSSQEAVRKPHPAELMTSEELATEKAEGEWRRAVAQKRQEVREAEQKEYEAACREECTATCNKFIPKFREYQMGYYAYSTALESCMRGCLDSDCGIADY